MLGDFGNIHRVRIYKLDQLKCSKEAKDGLEELLLTRLNENEYMNSSVNLTSENFTQLSINEQYEEDFVLTTHSKITSINLFGGDKITYS